MSIPPPLALRLGWVALGPLQLALRPLKLALSSLKLALRPLQLALRSLLLTHTKHVFFYKNLILIMGLERERDSY